MSAGVLPKPTRVTLCDICGEEIDTSLYSDYGARGSLLGGGLGGKATKRTPWMTLHWPSFEWVRKTSQPGGGGWKAREENPERNYDFHGKCLVALVETAIAERLSHDASTSGMPDPAHPDAPENDSWRYGY